jgi:hypothetical protein
VRRATVLRRAFVRGPWKTGYGLGTYGIDTKTHTAWAVLNYDGDCAVARFAEDVAGKGAGAEADEE